MIVMVSSLDAFVICWYYNEVWDTVYILHHIVVSCVETFVLVSWNLTSV